MIIEKVYSGRDNSIDLLLKADGAAVDLVAVSRMQLVVGATTLDSNTKPEYFDWSPDPPMTGKLVLNLGSAGLSAGERQPAALIVFGPGSTNGINWGSFYLDIS